MIDWKKVRRERIPFELVEGRLGKDKIKKIYLTDSGEEIHAGTTLGRKYLRENAGKKLAPPPISETKQSLARDPYKVNEIELAGLDHDFDFPISLKVKGLEHESKWLALNKVQYNRLIDLFK